MLFSHASDAGTSSEIILREFSGRFRLAVNFIMKARLSAKLFICKLVLFPYE